MRHLPLVIAAALAGALPALAQGPGPKPAPTPAATSPTSPIPPILAPGRTLLSTKDVMRHIVNPAAEAFWARSGVVDDEKGANDRTPADDANWAVSLDSAAQL